MGNNNKHKISVYMDDRTLKLIDATRPFTSADNRSEFISYAIETYAAILNKDNTSRVLTPALESVIGAKIRDTENHIANVLFKQGVELAMLMHVVAATCNFDSKMLADLRKTCVHEVSRLSGRYRFEDAAEYQEKNS